MPTAAARIVRLTSTAVCLRADCDWTCAGNPAHVDREARRHTGEPGLTGAVRHATSTETIPVLEV